MLETVEREEREVKMLRVGSDRYGPGQEWVHRRDSACWMLWRPSQRVQIGIVWTYTEEIYGWIARVHEVSQESMKGQDLQ